MVLLQQQLAEVGRRVARSWPPSVVALPAKAVDATVAQIPDDKDPRYASWKNTLKQRTSALLRSQNVRKDYAAVVDACVGCHRQFATGSLGQVERLRLPPAVAPPPK